MRSELLKTDPPIPSGQRQRRCVPALDIDEREIEIEVATCVLRRCRQERGQVCIALFVVRPPKNLGLPIPAPSRGIFAGVSMDGICPRHGSQTSKEMQSLDRRNARRTGRLSSTS